MQAELATTPAVEFEGVSLGFDGNTVLENISFRLESGETKIVLGASGSGKSVLLKLTMGLLQPDAGGIFAHELGDRASERAREVAQQHHGRIALPGLEIGEMALGDTGRFRETLAGHPAAMAQAPHAGAQR